MAENGPEQAALPHAMSCSNMDFDFFYAGLEAQTLQVQKCSACLVLRTPPSPVCSSCGSFDWAAVALSGRGHIHSYVVHHHPPLPHYDTPHAMLLVDMAEGLRFVAPLKPEQRASMAIGAPVTVEFVRRGGVALFQFALDGKAA